MNRYLVSCAVLLGSLACGNAQTTGTGGETSSTTATPAGASATSSGSSGSTGAAGSSSGGSSAAGNSSAAGSASSTSSTTTAAASGTTTAAASTGSTGAGSGSTGAATTSGSTSAAGEASSTGGAGSASSSGSGSSTGSGGSGGSTTGGTATSGSATSGSATSGSATSGSATSGGQTSGTGSATSGSATTGGCDGTATEFALCNDASTCSCSQVCAQDPALTQTFTDTGFLGACETPCTDNSQCLNAVSTCSSVATASGMLCSINACPPNAAVGAPCDSGGGAGSGTCIPLDLLFNNTSVGTNFFQLCMPVGTATTCPWSNESPIHDYLSLDLTIQTPQPKDPSQLCGPGQACASSYELPGICLQVCDTMAANPCPGDPAACTAGPASTGCDSCVAVNGHDTLTGYCESCYPPGTGCNFDTDCCGGSPGSGACTSQGCCALPHGVCNLDSECCFGLSCRANRCCSAAGGLCGSDADCCAGRCINSSCSQ